MPYVILDNDIDNPDDVVKRIMKSRGALTASCKDSQIIVKWKNEMTVVYDGKKKDGKIVFGRQLDCDILNKVNLTGLK